MNSLEHDVNLFDGSQVFDAKSLVGIMNLDINKIFVVEYITDDYHQLEKFNERIKKYDTNV